MRLRTDQQETDLLGEMWPLLDPLEDFFDLHKANSLYGFREAQEEEEKKLGGGRRRIKKNIHVSYCAIFEDSTLDDNFFSRMLQQNKATRQEQPKCSKLKGQHHSAHDNTTVAASPHTLLPLIL